jgi:hypothetical protein
LLAPRSALRNRRGVDQHVHTKRVRSMKRSRYDGQ